MVLQKNISAQAGVSGPGFNSLIALWAFCLDQDTLILQLANIIQKCVYSALTDKRDKNEQPQIK